MKPLLIIKTGNTVQSIPREQGDFEQWIARALQLGDGQVLVCNVSAGELLPDAAVVSGVVITGSAAMVTDQLPWSEYTAEWLRYVPELGLPVLGICYGHQLLAHAFGGEVAYHPQGREIGTTRIMLTEAAANDSLCAGLEPEFQVHVSHMQSVISLPPAARILACNAFEPHQAVRYHDRIWGVQFHPEFNETVMRAYLRERAAKLQNEGFVVEKLLQAVAPTPVASRLLLNFSGLVAEQQIQPV